MERAAAALRAGGVVLYPTETFYGLGALARDGAAVARLAAMKGRPDGKALPLVAADLAQAEEVADLGDPIARRLAAAFWPGPLGLVLPARSGLPELVAPGGTVAVRVPGSAVARALAAAAGGAIVSTSANLAGAPPAASLAEADPALRAAVDAEVDAGPSPGGLPSTLVAVETGRVRLVRAGAVALERVARAATE